MMYRTKNMIKGFTLIEVLVAVAVFSVVMLVAVGALLTVSEANRKAQALKEVTNNLNFALESISRSARVGTTYHCGTSSADPPSVTGNIGSANDCANGGKLFAFEPFGGASGDDSDQVIYRINNGVIERSTDGGTSFFDVTSPDVTISHFEVYVNGTESGDNEQPTVVLLLRGTASFSPRSTTEFNVQTSVTQRILDI